LLEFALATIAPPGQAPPDFSKQQACRRCRAKSRAEWRSLFRERTTEFRTKPFASIFQAGSLRFDPTGKSLAQFRDPSVKPLMKKYSDFQKSQISFITFAVPPQTEGRCATSRNVERDAVDAEARLTGEARADGEVVWS
jgi:hypothetical protein